MTDQMTADEFKAARRALGLSAREMALALGMKATSGRTVRRWEAGDRSIFGPVAVAVRLLLKEKRNG